MCKDRFIITIDGPAGAGKTTIASKVARKLHFRYVDTGAMYRAAALKVLKENIPFSKVKSVEKAVKDALISIKFSGEEMKIFLDGKDVSGLIRSREVTENTSIVASMGGVRDKMAQIQRRTADEIKRAVFEGRDMGSVVFPDARLKIYLDAGISERAKRRFEELRGENPDLTLKELEKEIAERDSRDASRGLAPLIVPTDAVIIDSTSMTISQVVESIVDLLDK